MRGFWEWLLDVIVVIVVLSLAAGLLVGWSVIAAILYIFAWTASLKLRTPKKR